MDIKVIGGLDYHFGAVASIRLGDVEVVLGERDARTLLAKLHAALPQTSRKVKGRKRA